jgi:bilirubin oxidase
MMAAFNVSQVDLSTYGYPEKISFNDPMSSLFRSKTYSGTDLSQIKDVLLPYFQNLNAYPDSHEVEKALDNYYKNPPSSSKSLTPASTTPTTLQTSAISTTVRSTTTDTSIKSEDKPKTTANTSSEDKPKTTAPVTSSSCSQGKGKNTCK